MQIGFVGLGRMGGNMVARIKRDSDHDVVAFDPSEEARQRAAGLGAVPADSLEDLVSKLDKPRNVWVMVPSGAVTQQTIDGLLELLEPDDLIIDGGNSKWTDTKAHHEQAAAKSVKFVDVGTSGGVWGLEVGYCMMSGGPQDAVDRIAPILDVLAPPTHEEWGPGWRRMGEGGAGHFVKMVHNGVEYGMMQAYAEGYELMHKSEYSPDLASVSKLWMQGSVVRSWLCELAAKAFEEGGNDLAELKGYVEDSGEGRWTILAAMDHDVPTPAITASLYARFYSRAEGDYTARVLAALRNQFGGHAVKKT